MKKEKSFTVIELLVVIAIIGLLSAVILVSLKGTRKKASIASGEQFSSHIYHRFGADAVGVWNFDDGTPKDSSGNGNDGTLEGNAEINEDSAKFRQGLSLDGNLDYVEVPDPGEESSLDIDGNTMTVEAWIRPENIGDWDTIAKKHESWFFTLYNVISGDDPGLKFRYYSGGSSYTLYVTDCIENEEWQHVAATYDGNEDGIKIFVNGKEVDSNSESGNINTNNEPVLIGSYSKIWVEGSFKGAIDEVRVYPESLSSAQIRKHYVEGAEEKGLVIK